MDPQTADIARACAAQLADEFDANLPALTERVLAGGAEIETRSTFDPTTVIALASLLVSTAGFAWTVYRDIKSDRKTAGAKSDPQAVQEVLKRRVRKKVSEQRGVTSGQVERITHVVVEETIRRMTDGST